MAYKLIEGSDIVIRLADNAFIPDDDGNSDRIAYRRWLADGNTPEPAEPRAPSVELLNQATIIRRLRDAELAALLVAQDSAPERARQMWNRAPGNRVDRNHPQLRAFFNQLFTADRVEDILAAEDNGHDFPIFSA